MGLLYKFLRVEDANSPLFGRAFSKVELRPFSREEAIEFLERGFSEINIQFKEHEGVYLALGGIPGWLTYFGFRYYELKEFNRALTETLS
jgi:Predicted ATPase (AAA+ superfamily)